MHCVPEVERPEQVSFPEQLLSRDIHQRIIKAPAHRSIRMCKNNGVAFPGRGALCEERVRMVDSTVQGGPVVDAGDGQRE